MTPPDSPEEANAPLFGAMGRRVPAFPTRHYPYQKRSPGLAVAAEVPTQFQPVPGRVYRFFLGRDPAPVLLTAEEVSAQLHDPFASIFLQRDRGPTSLNQLLGVLDAEQQQPGGLPRQQVFVVADGGQIPWSEETAALERNIRLAVVRHRGGQAELMVSTAAPFDSTEVFLQVLAWDEVAGAFQFYERRRGAWFWAGSSWEALADDTRGKGPFDSHVNGGVVMKELKSPWQNWHSMAASILPSALAPADSLRNDPLFTGRESADQLEVLVRGGLFRWTEARFKKRMVDGKLQRAPEFFRQLVLSTSVNLITSADASRKIGADSTLHLPRTFFLHSNALFDELGLHAAFPVPQTQGQNYLDCLARYDVALRADSFRFPGDTQFAFLVPEPALEDLVVLRGLLSRNLINRKLAAALLMVDFPNPVFSVRRARLAAYLPDEVTLEGAPGSFAERFLSAVQAAGNPAAGSPEAEFLGLWNTADNEWEEAFNSRLTAYLNRVVDRAATPAGFDDYFRLAESRRREFRKRPLAEFSLTTPSTNIPEDAPFLEMLPDGTLQSKSPL